MKPRSQKRLVWTLDAVLAMVVATAGTTLVLWPVPRNEVNESVPAAPAPAPVKVKRPLESYAVIYRMDFQRPLVDSAAGPAAVKPTVTLVGTVIQPGFTYAMLKNKAGETKWVSVGQTLDGAEVVEIAEDSATVKFAGTVIVLKIQKEGTGS
jgi:hypothetical protein